MNAPDCICSPGRLPLGAFCAGRDDLEREALHDDRISIRAPRAGCDQAAATKKGFMSEFQSTRPVWGATTIVRRPGNTTRFQSTRPVWGATCGSVTSGTSYPLFQSTRPVWGATMKKAKKAMCNVFQSTRPVWGATHSPASDPGCARISIHAPRVGRDSSFRRCPCTAAAFQSTRPVWGATRADGWRRYVLQHFNPRAPCGARRRGRLAAHAGMANFNPRAPCGARPPGSPFAPSLPDFNPRAPCGARQALTVFYRCHKAISIHAPRVGRDLIYYDEVYTA